MSFWSSIASGLTSMIPGVGPFIAPMVGGLVGGLTSKGGSGGSPAAVDPMQDPQIKQLMASLKTPATMDPATKGASDYYKTIMGGGEEATQSLLGPNVSTVLNQFDNASKAAAELGPRGGGRAAIQAETPFKKASAYTNLLGQAKSTAAAGMAGIGANQTAAATSRRSQDVSVLGTVLGGKTSLADRQMQINQENAKGMGKGIGSILTNLLAGGGNKNKNTPGLSSGASYAPQDPYEGSDTGD
jgi:hypothetical protein